MREGLLTLVHVGEAAQHALGVGLDAGEEAEGVDGLEHGHAAAVEGAAADLFCGAQEFGFEREVDDFRDPMLGPQKRGGEGQAGMLRHARWCGVDQTVGVAHGVGEVCSLGDAVCA